MRVIPVAARQAVTFWRSAAVAVWLWPWPSCVLLSRSSTRQARPRSDHVESALRATARLFWNPDAHTHFRCLHSLAAGSVEICPSQLCVLGTCLNRFCTSLLGISLNRRKKKIYCNRNWSIIFFS